VTARDRLGPILWRALVVMLFVFLLSPIAVGVIISFSAGSTLAFPPPGWSLRWYEALLHNREFQGALTISVLVATSATGLSTLIGVPAAIAIVRRLVPGHVLLSNAFALPLLIPGVTIGLGLLVIIAPLGLKGTIPALLGAHVLITFPFIIRIVGAALSTVPPSLEEAAATLGASPIVAFRRVVLPEIMPSILAAAAIAFIVSLGEAAITLFVSGNEIRTLPVAMLRYLTSRTDPQLASVSVVLLVFTFAAVLIAGRTGATRLIGEAES
jgi:putative spermidine/putrescine transport system permease protein